MPAFCLTKQQVEKLKKAFMSREINPDMLSEMTSEERHAKLSEYVGKTNALQVNALFESKLLLKNQKQGMIAWANRTLNGPPEIKRDIISRIQKMNKALDAKSKDAFLKDLAEKKLGISISFEEAQKITELSKAITKKRDFTNEQQRIEYGNAILDLQDYVDELTGTNGSVYKQLANVVNLPRTAMSIMDLSGALRQGWGLMGRPEYREAFVEMFKYATSETAYRNLMADIITQPTYNLMKSSKLRITKLDNKLEQREEDFMSNLLDKFPGVRGSERAYTGFLNKLRSDVFNSMIRDLEAMGEDVTPGSKAVNDVAEMINTFTGSGNIGKGDKYAGAVPFLNGILFSPRKTFATINMFNPVKYVKMHPYARKQALKQLFSSISLTSTVLALCALAGGDVEKNPLSSDFGKAKFGNTRFDFTGGNGNYITLLARLITGKQKSTTTDLVKELGEGYGSPTRGDIAFKWMRNKLSPVGSFVADALYGENAIGEPFKLLPAIRDRIIPMTISSTFDTLKEDPQLTFFSAVLGTLGVGVNSYSSEVNWNTSESKELIQFKEKAGQDKFDEANAKYNEEFVKRFDKLQTNPTYIKLSDEEKAKQITKLKEKVKEETLKKYRFKYVQEKQPKVNIQL